MIYTTNMTQKSYKLHKSKAEEHNADIWPAYTELWLWRKRECAPEGMEFSDTEARVPMESVLHHQCSRMFDDVLTDEIARLHNENPDNEFVMHHKFGADGYVSRTPYFTNTC